MGRFLKLVFVLITLSACGAGEVTVNAPPSGGNSGGANSGGGNLGSSSGSLVCAMTGCEIARLATTGIMPTGSAFYLGAASVARTDSLGAIITTNAALQVNANFTSRSMILQLSEFTDGTINYTGTAQGSASLTGAQFMGNYAGNLTSSAGLTPISGSVTGQFRGIDAVTLDGDMVANGWGGADAHGRFFANKQ